MSPEGSQALEKPRHSTNRRARGEAHASLGCLAVSYSAEHSDLGGARQTHPQNTLRIQEEVDTFVPC
jgi:hypothetical protein